jgi:hypothetical protein
MYVKQQRRQVQGMYVPDNYHGTAFTEEQEVSEQSEESLQAEVGVPKTQAAPAIQKQESGLLSSLFSGFGGLRSDDVLLLALIVLLSRSDEKGKGSGEILPLLAILLFLG